MSRIPRLIVRQSTLFQIDTSVWPQVQFEIWGSGSGSGSGSGLGPRSIL